MPKRKETKVTVEHKPISKFRFKDFFSKKPKSKAENQQPDKNIDEEVLLTAESVEDEFIEQTLNNRKD